MSLGLRKWVLVLLLQAAVLLPAIALAGPKYPSPSTLWTARQYTDFYFVHFNTHLALPHLRNAESRALFERLTDRDNVERILSASSPVEEKQLQLRMILAVIGGVRASYNLAVVIGEPLQEELTQIQVFQLYLAGATAELAGADMKNSGTALKTAVFGVVQSLSEPSYSGAQLTSLSDAVARRYLVLSPLFAESERRDLRLRVAALQRSQTNPNVALALARLRATLETD